MNIPPEVRALLDARTRTLPAELARALEMPAAFPPMPDGASFVVTGVGASEGPARYLASLLHLAGRRAVFTPLSSFLFDHAPSLGDTLVLFSQNLSPNARLALRRASHFARACLVTSVDPSRTPSRTTGEQHESLAPFLSAGGHVLTLPPDDESGTLVRLVGPAVALLVSARWAQSLGAPITMQDLARVPVLAQSAGVRAERALHGLPTSVLHRRLAWVSSGPWMEGLHGLRCKWLEGLGAQEPSLWDVLQVAHGPFHQSFDEEVTWVSLEHARFAEERDVFTRLEQMLVPPRHSLVRLCADLPPPLGPIDHDLLTTALLMRALRERSKDIAGALGQDAPLYGLGKTEP